MKKKSDEVVKNVTYKNFVPTKPEPVTPENIQIISDDELRKRIINGSLDDPKLETTLFPNGKPSK